MDKWQALDTYWNGYGMQAYNELTVPDNAAMPYITYQAAVGSLDGPMRLSGSLYWRGNSWAWGMQKATAMLKAMDREIKVDGGYVKFRLPQGFQAQPQTEPSDEQVRRIIFQVDVEFLTN